MFLKKSHGVLGEISLVSCISIHYELLKLNGINSRSFIKYKISKHNKIIILFDNAQNIFGNTQLGSLISYAVLFLSKANGLFEQDFTYYERNKKCMESWIAPKDEPLF